MALVRVHNDNVHDYQEKFREKDVKIPAKGFIEMEESDAKLFKGSFAPIQVDADGSPIPQGFKMIRIERITQEAPKVHLKENICQACRYEGSSDKDLSEHIKAEHADIAVVDEEAEREMVAKKRGRPPKNVA